MKKLNQIFTGLSANRLLLPIILSTLTFAVLMMVYELQLNTGAFLIFATSAAIATFLASLMFLSVFRTGQMAHTENLDKFERVSKSFNNLEQDLNDTIDLVNRSVQEQSVAIQNIDGSLALIQEIVKNNVEQFSSIVKNVAAKGEQGHKIIQDLVAAMSALGTTSAQLHNISGIIRKVSSETNVINDIVLKTQLLSFNAFLEAARAGEHGSGFAVVAEEVGNLAQSSGNAAKQIVSLISDSESNVNDILKKTKSRIGEARQTNEIAKELFDEIVENLSQGINQINAVSNDQSEGIAEIFTLIERMKTTTKFSVDVSQKLGIAAEKVRRERMEVDGLVREIKSRVEMTPTSQADNTSKQNLVATEVKAEAVENDHNDMNQAS